MTAYGFCLILSSPRIPLLACMNVFFCSHENNVPIVHLSANLPFFFSFRTRDRIVRRRFHMWQRLRSAPRTNSTLRFSDYSRHFKLPGINTTLYLFIFLRPFPREYIYLHSYVTSGFQDTQRTNRNYRSSRLLWKKVSYLLQDLCWFSSSVLHRTEVLTFVGSYKFSEMYSVS